VNDRLKIGEFKELASPVLDGSVARECRYVVLIRDKTSDNAKKQYKENLSTVHKYFFTYEKRR